MPVFRASFLLHSLAIAWGLVAGGEAARAADARQVEAIVSNTGSDRQQMLEAGARKEGGLLIYTVGAQIDPLIAGFRKHYPWLEVRLFKADTSSVVRRVKEEYRAGVYNVDAFELNDYGLASLLPDDLLAPFRSPEFANYPDEAIEPGRRWVMMRQDLISLGFNTGVIPEAEAPRTHADLLDPKWKDRFGLYGESSAIAHWIGALLESDGDAFLRKVVAQRPRVYNMGGRAVGNLIVSGEAPIVLNARSSHMFASRKAGANVAWRAIGPAYASVSAAAIARRADHPHAAALFVDYMLSHEAQKMYRDDLGYVSMRKDLVDAGAPVKKLYLDSRPNFEADYEKWLMLGRQLLTRPR